MTSNMLNQNSIYKKIDKKIKKNNAKSKHLSLENLYATQKSKENAGDYYGTSTDKRSDSQLEKKRKTAQKSGKALQSLTVIDNLDEKQVKLKNIYSTGSVKGGGYRNPDESFSRNQGIKNAIKS